MRSLLGDVKFERTRYGATMTNNECVELLNAVAWKNRGDGWGLGEKTSGNRGRRSDGKQCTVDGLVYGPTMAFVDALRDAGGKSEPQWSVAPNPSNRKWVAPIAPGTQPDEEPTPPPPPPDPHQPMPDPQIAELVALVSELGARLAKVEARMPELKTLADKLLALEGAEYRLIPIETSREWGHTHDVEGRVVRVVK